LFARCCICNDSHSMESIIAIDDVNKGNNKITELWTILQRESQNS
jgi:hypothetical protein